MSTPFPNHIRMPKRMIGRELHDPQQCLCGEPWPCPAVPDTANWHAAWEEAGRDSDGNLILRFKESGGLYHLIPAEDL